MKKLLLICLLLPGMYAAAQCKTYKLNGRGDTLNCTDMNDLKQGWWDVKVAALRGEPGYQEMGAYKDNKKVGEWKTFSLIGDPIAVEHFRFGYKDGSCIYYNLNGIIREESWKATDPKYPYDTVDVPDLNTDTVYRRVVKVESSTVKQGTWKYYNPQTGALLKTEEYVLDQLVDPAQKAKLTSNKADSTSSAKPDPSKIKPPEILQYEKKNEGKKKIKVRDGATGG